MNDEDLLQREEFRWLKTVPKKQREVLLAYRRRVLDYFEAVRLVSVYKMDDIREAYD